MKRILHIATSFYHFFIGIFIVLIIGFIIFPQQMTNIIGYRFYTVLTDSMEPLIPTYSVVLTKIMDENEIIEPNTIVTFKANRFGEDIMLTHYFGQTEEVNGQIYYRTHAQGVEQFDMYDTTRNDIVGKYVMHIPFIGKLLLFYKSKFGILVLAEYGVIFLINLTLKTRWKENNNLDEEVHFHKKTTH